MAYQVLARKWRPQNFSQIVGQEHVSKSLINALQHQRLHHAYLFTGTRGVGKTTIARIIAKAINCENLQDFNPCGQCAVCKAFDSGRFMDLIEVDAASRTKVEDTRDLLDNAQYAPNQGRYKVYLIDEVHMLSGHSFNALLKTLEEPPEHVKFLLATTDPHKIPVTVLSRCLQFNLKRLLPEQINQQMQFILQQEQIEYDQEGLMLLARAADGSMRDGLSLLDQAIAFGQGRVNAVDVHAMLGTIAQQPVEHLLRALAAQDGKAILGMIANMAELTPDFADVLQQLLRMLHRIALIQVIPGYRDPELDQATLVELAEQISATDVQLYYQIGLLGQKDLDLTPDPRCGFEMVMLRMLAFKPVSQISLPSSVNAKAPSTNAQPQLVSAPETSLASPATTSTPVSPPPLVNTGHAVSNEWANMISRMNLSGMTRQVANHCVLKSVDDTTCTLLIDPGSTSTLSPKVKENLQAALQNYYGKPLKLIINSQKIDSITPAIQQQQQREDRQQAAVQAIQNDPNIKALQENFDAKILTNTIKPI